MPAGSEGSHTFDGLTVRGGLQIGEGLTANTAGVQISPGDNLFIDGGIARPGIETYSRWFATTSTSLVSQTMRVSYFKAPFNFTANTVTYSTVATAAAATPTLIRYGIYSRNAGGDLTLIASTPNDTALLVSINTEYPKALSTPVTLVGGQRYGLAILVVSSQTMPAVVLNAGLVGGLNAAAVSGGPIGGTIAAQSDLPATVTYGSLTNSNSVYGLVT